MRMRHFPTASRIVIAISAMLAAPALIFAQGETFTDCDSWSAAVCGNILGDDFESLVDDNGNQIPEDFGLGNIPSPQSLAWGELSQETLNGPSIVAFHDIDEVDVEFPLGVAASNDFPVTFTPDTAALGPLEGVCFEYFGVPSLTNTFNVYDGDTLVASFPLIIELGLNDVFDSATFGWKNTEGLNVTRFEFQGSPEGFLSLFGNGQLSFGDGCDPPTETCFDQLAVVEANLADFVGTLSGNDACYAQGALGCVNWMQHDCFWEQPSGDRLSQYGGSMFIGAAYAVSYLEWVDNPEADVLIDELLSVLECIVDNEIAYAIANGGNQCYIDRAEDFAELGTIIDEDFDNEVIATLAYRLAWLNAYYSTN